MSDINDAGLQAAIKKAKQKDFERSAQTKMRNLQRSMAADAKARGLGEIRFTAAFAYKDRGKQAGLWPMALTDMLLKDKRLVRESNEKLMQLVCAQLKIEPYPGSKLSDEPSKGQRDAVVKRLEAHGFVNPVFKNMTAVKRLIAGGPTAAPRKASASVSISFDGPDRLVIDTRSYPVEARRGKPTGAVVEDRCARIRDARVPIAVVLEVLGVSMQRGQEMYAAAVRHAQIQEQAERGRERRAEQDAAVDGLFEADQLEPRCLAQDT